MADNDKSFLPCETRSCSADVSLQHRLLFFDNLRRYCRTPYRCLPVSTFLCLPACVPASLPPSPPHSLRFRFSSLRRSHSDDIFGFLVKILLSSMFLLLLLILLLGVFPLLDFHVLFFFLFLPSFPHSRFNLFNNLYLHLLISSFFYAFFSPSLLQMVPFLSGVFIAR